MRFNTPIEIRTPQKTTTGQRGGSALTGAYARYRTFAEIKPISFAQGFESERIVQDVTHNVTIRFTEKVNHTAKEIWQGKRCFKIHSYREGTKVEQRRTLVFLCKEIRGV